MDWLYDRVKLSLVEQKPCILDKLHKCVSAFVCMGTIRQVMLLQMHLNTYYTVTGQVYGDPVICYVRYCNKDQNIASNFLEV